MYNLSIVVVIGRPSFRTLAYDCKSLDIYEIHSTVRTTATVMFWDNIFDALQEKRSLVRRHDRIEILLANTPTERSEKLKSIISTKCGIVHDLNRA